MTKKNLAIFGGSFDPPGVHHFFMAVDLIRRGFRVIVVPCGIRPEPEKRNLAVTLPHHRAKMLELNFEILLGTGELRLELFDLNSQSFTRTHVLQKMFEEEGDVWHVAGSDLLQGGRFGQSPIHRGWEFGLEIFDNYYFTVFLREGYDIEPEDTPANSIVILAIYSGSSTKIRHRRAMGKSIEGLVMPKVGRYIYENGLYLPE